MEINWSEQATGIPGGVSMYAHLRGCDICSKEFELYHYKDGRRICPECVERMHKVLYPELHEEDCMKPVLD